VLGEEGEQPHLHVLQIVGVETGACILRVLRHRLPQDGFRLTYCLKSRSAGASSTATSASPSASLAERHGGRGGWDGGPVLRWQRQGLAVWLADAIPGRFLREAAALGANYAVSRLCSDFRAFQSSLTEG
jgi:hypothetical protein